MKKLENRVPCPFPVSRMGWLVLVFRVSGGMACGHIFKTRSARRALQKLSAAGGKTYRPKGVTSASLLLLFVSSLLPFSRRKGLSLTLPGVITGGSNEICL